MSDRIAIFAGPSLPPGKRPTHARLTWLPPAATGDVLRIRDQGFACICLIDGYFDHRPAPWHKELLTVMAARIRLIGASSMGALRAAELDGLGMEGVGVIYCAYRNGLLTGDDEVALIHGTEAIGWAAASVPMVEVRATLIKALRLGMVDGATVRRMRSVAHDVHYTDRDWPLLQKLFVAEGLADEDHARRLSALHVPLKQHDAELCIATALAGGLKPTTPNVPLTNFLQALEREISAS